MLSYLFEVAVFFFKRSYSYEVRAPLGNNYFFFLILSEVGVYSNLAVDSLQITPRRDYYF